MWSLGFILSLAATYVILGYNGIRRFNEFLECASVRLRNAASKADRRVVSPLATSRYDDNGVLEEVRCWHQYLRGCMRQTSATTQILDIAEKNLLLRDAMRRTTAYELSSSFSRLLHVKRVERTTSRRVYGLRHSPPRYRAPALQTRGTEHSTIEDLHAQRSVSSSWKDRQQPLIEEQFFILDFRQDKPRQGTRKPISAIDRQRTAWTRRAGACFRCRKNKLGVIRPHTELPRSRQSASLLTVAPSVTALHRHTCRAEHVPEFDRVRFRFLVFWLS